MGSKQGELGLFLQDLKSIMEKQVQRADLQDEKLDKLVSQRT